MKLLKGSIKLRILLFVCMMFVFVFGGFFLINQNDQNSMITDLYDQGIDEIQTTFARHVEYIMLMGENEKIQPLIEQMHQEKMASEITIVDADGIIARSTNQSIIGKKDADPVWSDVYRNNTDTVFDTRLNDIPVVVSYKAFANTGDCTDCHDESEKTLGGLKVVKSKQAMADRQNASFWFTLLIGIAGSAIIFLGILWIQNRWVFNPLKDVGEKLERASNGDIDQTIKCKSNDEIGKLLKSINNLMDYIRGLSTASGEIAKGNLTIDVELKSEQDVLGHSFKTMLNNLNEIIHKLTDNSRDLTSAAQEISTASEESSRGAKEQTSQVNQIATAIEQMSATVVETSRHSADASKTAQEAADTAATGRDVVAQTIQGMQSIADVVKKSAENISKLAKSAEQIGEIISVIDDIADQTNLLALNAAIEAARAGEQGRGFAVVADEVRKLAERTGKATGEITEMIKGIQSETNQAVQSMETGISEVDKGRELADKAGQSLSQIADASHQVLQMIEQIATASEQQAVASEEIAKNVDHITNIVKESEIAFDQTASGAEQLNAQADNLRSMVNRFEIKGGNAGMLKIAQNDHRNYMQKLRKLIDGNADIASWQEKTHQTCNFGKWYYSDGMTRFGRFTSYKSIEKPHIDVHQYANEAVQAYIDKNQEHVQKALSKAREASHEVLSRCEATYQEIMGAMVES